MLLLLFPQVRWSPLTSLLLLFPTGEVGLDKLRKTAQMVRDVPSLNAVLHFLSVSTHQEYLVYRIRGG